MWTRHRHRWLNALAVLLLVVSVPLLQGAGLHLHLEDDVHGAHLHGAQSPGHTHHHDGSDDVDLTPQATGQTGSALEIVFVPVLVDTPDAALVGTREPPPSPFSRPHLRPPPSWLTRPLRGPPA